MFAGIGGFYFVHHNGYQKISPARNAAIISPHLAANYVRLGVCLLAVVAGPWFLIIVSDVPPDILDTHSVTIRYCKFFFDKTTALLL